MQSCMWLVRFGISVLSKRNIDQHSEFDKEFKQKSFLYSKLSFIHRAPFTRAELTIKDNNDVIVANPERRK